MPESTDSPALRSPRAAALDEYEAEVARAATALVRQLEAEACDPARSATERQRAARAILEAATGLSRNRGTGRAVRAPRKPLPAAPAPSATISLPPRDPVSS